MTQDAEARAPAPETPASPRRTDLLGFAYIASTGVVMTAWIGGLIWAGVEVVKWLIS
jgi:hypothetical protein